MNESLSNAFRASADQGLDHSVPISETGAVDLAASERRALVKRLAELTAANAATDRALQRLSEGTTPDGFVRSLQREMIELLGGK